MVNRILVATDFSQTAARALRLAVDIARRSGDKLVLLHVVEPPRLMEPLVAGGRAPRPPARDRARLELGSVVEQVRGSRVHAEARFEEGYAPEAVADVAREVGARLIVIGSHGRRGMARLLLGSVAHRTLLRADRPVLVARSGQSAARIDEWAAGTRPLRVTFAVDRSPATAAAAAWIRGFRELGPIDLRMVHVYEPVLEAVRLGLRASEDGHPDLEAALAQELWAAVGDPPQAGGGASALDLHPSAARPGAVIARQADAAGADLLLLGTHQRTGVQRIWLGSTAEPTLRAANIPVVCVPALSREALAVAGREEIGKGEDV